MTKNHATEPASDESMEILTGLKRSYDYALQLSAAARAVSATFRWCHATGLRPIMVLDFDVIGGAFPSLLVREVLRRSEESDDPFSISRLWGPSGLRVIFRHLDELVVPPGAAAELIAGMQHLNERLSERAVAFIGRIRRASNLDDPSNILEDPRLSGEKDILLEDLTRFDEDLRDRRILEDLLSRAIPAKELLAERGHGHTEMEVFRDSYGFLRIKRPRRSFNNFNDALNLALLVRLFNSTVVAKEDRRIPVFISETRAVRESNALVDRYLRRLDPEEEKPMLFNDGLFLLIGMGLLHATQNRYGIAGDEAERMADDSASIASGCLALRNECTRQMKAGTPERELSLSDLPKHDLALVYYRRELFERSWARILAPSVVANRRDQLDYLNFLLSPNNRELLKANVPSELSKFTDDLKHARTDNYALWNLLQRFRQSPSAISIYARAFDYCVVENDGSLLREMQPELPLEQTAISLEGTHDKLIAVWPTYVSAGAIISVRSFRDEAISKNRYVSFTWLHRVDLATILPEILNLLLTNFLASRLQLSLFSETNREIRNLNVEESRQEVHALSEKARLVDDRTAHFDFVHLRADTRSVFADLQLLNGTEMQANLTIATSEFTRGVQSALLDVVASTCEMPISAGHLGEVLRPVYQALKLELP